MALASVERTPSLLSRTVGMTGWYDTFIAPRIAVVFLVLVIGVLLAALLSSTIRVRVALLLGIVMYIAVPILMEASVLGDIGFMWLPRYALPLPLPVLRLAVLGITDSAQGAGRQCRSGSARAHAPLALGTVAGLVQAVELVDFAFHAARRFWADLGTGATLLEVIPPVGVLGLLLTIGGTALAVVGMAAVLRSTAPRLHTTEGYPVVQ